MILTQIQRMLLVEARGRHDGRLVKPARASAKRLDAALQGLTDAGLVASAEVLADKQEAGNALPYRITPAGRDLLAAEEDGVVPADLPETGQGSNPVAAGKPAAGGSKIGVVLALLGRDQGATLAELGAATDWLPHSVRAALTGLRKKGHVITRDRRDDVSIYRLGQEG